MTARIASGSVALVVDDLQRLELHRVRRLLANGVEVAEDRLAAAVVPTEPMRSTDVPDGVLRERIEHRLAFLSAVRVQPSLEKLHLLIHHRSPSPLMAVAQKQTAPPLACAMREIGA